MTNAAFSVPSLALTSRSCTVTVGTVEVSNIGQQVGLDVWFDVKRSLKPSEPNTCDLRLFNLSDDTRKKIEQSAQPMAPGGGGAPGADNTTTPVKIVAGYVGGTSTLFLGELRSAHTVTDGSTTTTELTTGDGDDAAILARSTSQLGKGANAYTVALKLIADMGCGQGNIASVASILRAAPLYSNGVVLKGASYDILRDLASGCGLEVTLQSGVLLWLSKGQPIAGQAYLLQTNPTNTGVIGEPTVDTKGVLQIETLMLPGLAPGSAIQVKTAYIAGLYRITSIETKGNTAGNEWGHSIEAKLYSLAP